MLVACTGTFSAPEKKGTTDLTSFLKFVKLGTNNRATQKP